MYLTGLTAHDWCVGCNGLISSVTNLTAPVSEWVCGGVPITMMCHMERRHGNMKPVIKKALVELEGEPFKCFAAQREAWAKYDLYRSPGPIQFFTDEDRVELSITVQTRLCTHTNVYARIMTLTSTTDMRFVILLCLFVTCS